MYYKNEYRQINNSFKQYFKIQAITAIISCALTLHVSAAPFTGQPKFQPKQLTPAEISNKKIPLAKGLTFDLADYTQATSLRNNPKVNFVFDRNFQQRNLKKTPLYSEKVEDLGDRSAITRTLIIEPKDPCANEFKQKGMSLCFIKSDRVPKNKKLMSQYLNAKRQAEQEVDQIRNRIKQALNTGKYPNKAGFAKSGSTINLSERKKLEFLTSLNNDQLLEHILNRSEGAKRITHTSVISHRVYDKKQAKKPNLWNLNQTLPQSSISSPAQKQAGTFSTTVAQINAFPSFSTSQIQAATQNANGLFWNNTNNFNNLYFLTGHTVVRHTSEEYRYTFAEENFWHGEYYARFSYDFDFDMGLRMPFQVTGSSRINSVYAGSNNEIQPYPATQTCNANTQSPAECAYSAVVNLSAQPVSTANSTSNFYQQLGLPSNQILSGKEFILDTSADCQLDISIPGPDIHMSCPSVATNGVSIKRDFSPPLFSAEHDVFNFTDSSYTTLGINSWFGHFRLYPGAKLRAGANFNIDVSPINSQVSLNSLNFSGQQESFNVGVSVFNTSINNDPNAWGFKIANPEYRLHGSLTPKIKLDVAIGIAGYGWDNTYGPYNLDSLALNLNHSFHRHNHTPNHYDLKTGSLASSLQVHTFTANPAFTQIANTVTSGTAGNINTQQNTADKPSPVISIIPGNPAISTDIPGKQLTRSTKFRALSRSGKPEDNILICAGESLKSGRNFKIIASSKTPGGDYKISYHDGRKWQVLPMSAAYIKVTQTGTRAILNKQKLR